MLPLNVLPFVDEWAKIDKDGTFHHVSPVLSPVCVGEGEGTVYTQCQKRGTGERHTYARGMGSECVTAGGVWRRGEGHVVGRTSQSFHSLLICFFHVVSKLFWFQFAKLLVCAHHCHLDCRLIHLTIEALLQSHKARVNGILQLNLFRVPDSHPSSTEDGVHHPGDIFRREIS